MNTLAFSTIALAAVAILSSPALADPPKGDPTYIGQRSTNPEQETFGYRTKTESSNVLAFVGPARAVGRVTGDAERDTIAYMPLLGTQTSSVWVFQLARE